MSTHFSRREFLCAGVAAAFAFRPSSACSRAIDGRGIIDFARRQIKNKSEFGFQSHVAAIVDFASPSWSPRLHLVDMRTSEIRSFLTAHGRGSDPSHTGWLKRFSNSPGSKATSAGAYKTAQIYDGKYGRSMRLVGLDHENSNAEARAIVIHPAWYVHDSLIDKHGKIGRSEGCFAVSEGDHIEILERLGEGALLFAGRL